MAKEIIAKSNRIVRLETTVENIEGRLSGIEGTLISIQKVLSGKRETNWSLIFAGIVVAITLYASAIRPLTADVERQSTLATKLAEAVLIQNDKIASSILLITELKIRQEYLIEQLRGGGKIIMP